MKLMVCSVFLLLIINVSFARIVGELPKKKYIKEESLSINIKKIKLTQPKIDEYKTKKKSARKVAPPKLLNFSVRLKGKERRLEKALDREIKELFRLIKKYKKSKVRGELWLRQAELYREKAKLSYYRRQDDHELKVSRWEKNGRKGQRPVLSFADVKKLNYKAIQLYKWFLGDFPKSKKRPLALFYLGYNYFEVEKFKEGMKAYEKLSKEYPKSSITYQALFNLGEFYFENKKWEKAEKTYTRVLKNKNKENYLFSLYKISWIKFHLGNVEKALKSMKKVYRLSKSRKTAKLSRKGVPERIKKEAQRNLVFFYAETGAYKEAIAFFEKTNSLKKLSWYLETLGDSYADRGEIKKSLYLYNQFLNRFPNDENAPRVFFSRISLVNTWERPIAYQKQLLNGVRRFGKKSQWGSVNLKEGNTSLEFFRDKIKKWMLKNYRALQFKKNQLYAKLMLEMSPLYFQSFKERKEDDDIRYLYGDLLYEQKRYSRAMAQYEKVISSKVKSKYYKNALLNLVLAAEKRLPDEKFIYKFVGDRKTPIKFSKSIEVFEDNAKRYIAEYPKDTETLPIKYRLGRIYYLLNHFDKAEPVYTGIVKEYPKSKYAEYSANLMLDMYNLNKNYKKISSFGNLLIKKNRFKDKSFNKNITSMIEQAEFKEAEAYILKGEVDKGIVEYKEFAHNHRRSPLLGVSYYNIAVNMEKKKEYGEAIRYYELALNHKKNEKYAKIVTKIMGPLYEGAGDFEKAAWMYDLYGKKYATSKEKPLYFQNAGSLWSGLGGYKNAVKSFNDMAINPQKKKESLKLIADLNEDFRYFKSADTTYRALLTITKDKDEKCHWKFKQSMLKKKRSRLKEYNSGLLQTQKCFNQIGKGVANRYLKDKADIQFQLAEKDFFEVIKPFHGIATVARQKTLEKKLALLKVLDNKLKDIILLDVSEFIVSSLVLSGEAHGFMAKFVASMPLPRGIAGADLQNYKAQVNGIVENLKKQSETNVSLAKEKAADLGVVTPALRAFVKRRVKSEGKTAEFNYLNLMDGV